MLEKMCFRQLVRPSRSKLCFFLFIWLLLVAQIPYVKTYSLPDFLHLHHQPPQSQQLLEKLEYLDSVLTSITSTIDTSTTTTPDSAATSGSLLADALKTLRVDLSWLKYEVLSPLSSVKCHLFLDDVCRVHNPQLWTWSPSISISPE